MAGSDAAFTALSVVLLGAIVAGLAVRGRWRRLRFLPVYAVVTLLAAWGALVWPERLHVWRFWLVKEAVVRLLGAAILVELAARVFARMPAARRALQVAAVASIAAGGVLLGIGPGERVLSPGADPLMLLWAVDVLPRLAFASAWLSLVLLAVAVHYMVPLDPLHRAVLYGFTPYLTLYALTIGSTGDAGSRSLANLANGMAYVLMLCLWTHAVWRREVPPDVPPWVIAWLQPWR